jgi:SAM-dependent methyltransferase
MPSRRAYDWMYRVFAPWSKADRYEIRQLVTDGPCRPSDLAPPEGPPARAIDLGCGEGGVAIWLAQAGFRTVGVDFSTIALRKARAAAERAGLDSARLWFAEADLTGDSIAAVPGPFDLLVDYSTLDDLSRAERARMARLVTKLARPGSHFFLDAWVGDRDELPRISFVGPSRMSPALAPGEVEGLFAADWHIERLPRPGNRFIANFLMVKR